jgi:hypothetical protein
LQQRPLALQAEGTVWLKACEWPINPAFFRVVGVDERIFKMCFLSSNIHIHLPRFDGGRKKIFVLRDFSSASGVAIHPLRFWRNVFPAHCNSVRSPITGRGTDAAVILQKKERLHEI